MLLCKCMNAECPNQHWSDLAPDAQRAIVQGVERQIEDKTPATQRPCNEIREGHRHCKHGHLEDCPDPEDCTLLPKEQEDKLWPPSNLETK